MTDEVQPPRSGPSRRMVVVLAIAAVLALAFGGAALALGGGDDKGGTEAVGTESRSGLENRSETTVAKKKTTTTTVKRRKKTTATTAPAVTIAPTTAPRTTQTTRHTTAPQVITQATPPPPSTTTPPPPPPKPPKPTVSLSGPSSIQAHSANVQYHWSVNAKNATRGKWSLPGINVKYPNWAPGDGFYFAPFCDQVGNYTLTLTVYSADGQSASASKSITVTPCY
jgi:hypothetical protein